MKIEGSFCGYCGVAVSTGESKQMSKWALSVPIVGIVLGALGLTTFFDSYWDIEALIGCIILFALPPIVLGVVALVKSIHKTLSIISVVIGGVNLFGYIAIFFSQLLFAWVLTEIFLTQ